MEEHKDKKVNFMDDLVKAKILQLENSNIVMNKAEPELNDYGMVSLDK